MNENAKKWVEALRSGRYKQTSMFLRRKKISGFCCLGVACEISGLGQWDDDGAYLGDVSTLPTEVCNWLGVKSWDPEITLDGNKQTLSYLNDRNELNFRQIADLIESHADEIFI